MNRNLLTRFAGIQFSGAFLLLVVTSTGAQEINVDPESLTFLATFDSGLKADFARGSKEFKFAEDVGRKKFLAQVNLEGVSIGDDGKFGGAIDFSKKTKQVLCYAAEGNFPYSEKPFDATISFWMKCDPGKLPPGFIDPLQITDKKWNDASIFVDFNDQRPADFRLGVFSNLSFWNPQNRDFNKMKPEERPMVDAGKVRFLSEKWVHIGLVFEGINSGKKVANCKLFIDGKLIGNLARKQKFEWDLKQAYIMLGIYYVGKIDDFAIFKVALSDDQLNALVKSKKSVSQLLD